MTIIGLAINDLTPSGRSGGEPVRAYLLSKSSNESFKTTFATVMSDKIFDTLPFMVLAIFAISYLMFTLHLGTALFTFLLFALLIFIAVHFIIFSGKSDDGVYRLREFDMLALISQILMVISLIVHLITNIKPLRISLGITDKRNLRTDIAIILSVLLFLSAVTFLIYYIRWQVI